MKKSILLFGANGKTGVEVVKQALAEGYEVTAFVRTPTKLDLKHQNLTIFQGDVLDENAVEEAVQGHDLVMCTLGTPALHKFKLRAVGTKNIISAMKKNDVKRFICQSSLGFGDTEEMLPFFLRYLVVPFYLKRTFEDHEVQENYIKASDLDWTIVRPGTLTKANKTGVYKHGFASSEKVSLKISHADVADFMIKQIEDEQYLKQTPGLSY